MLLLQSNFCILRIIFFPLGFHIKRLPGEYCHCCSGYTDECKEQSSRDNPVLSGRSHARIPQGKNFGENWFKIIGMFKNVDHFLNLISSRPFMSVADWTQGEQSHFNTLCLHPIPPPKSDGHSGRLGEWELGMVLSAYLYHDVRPFQSPPH